MADRNDATHVIRTLRAQAWARAKGELEALEHTFWGEHDQFKAFSKLKEAFITEVEDNALQE